MEVPSHWNLHRRSRRRAEPTSCPNCKDFDWDELQQHVWDHFFTRTEDVAQSATSGCATCQILSRAVEHCFPHVARTPSGYKIAFHGLDGPMHWDVVSPGDDLFDAARPNNFFEIFSYKGEPSPWPLVGPAHDFDYSLDGALIQAREWLKTCQTKHPRCGVLNGTKLPKRVVRVNREEANKLHGPDHPQVSLYETQDGEIGDYVCLSHCWGTAQIITTTSDNIEKHRAKIQWSDLSKTFQDAITFSDKMGIDNIWIDSLCIIQNSREDWESEALKMASYYINGQFSIAATSSTNGAGGLYHTVLPKDETMQIEGLDPKSNTRYRVGVRKSIPHHHDVLEDKSRTKERFPLLTRGWVYQERILSRRFIHFGPREVHWECHEEVFCQCGGIQAALELNPSGKATANQALAISRSGLKTDEMVLLWSRQIESLTKLDFTYISDHLAALAGIATLMVQSGQSGRYLAGLWQEGLLFWLCWSSTKGGARTKSLSGIPTWSWASVEGQITYDFMTHYFQTGPWGEKGHRHMLLTKSAHAEVAECIPDQPPLSGKLNSGVLTVTGDAAPGTLRCKTRTEGDTVFEFVLENESGHSDFSGVQIHWAFCCDSNDPASAADLDGQKIIVLHLLSYERLWVEYDGPYWMRSMLILKPAEGTKTKYHRVGILYSDVSGHFVPSKIWREMESRYGLPLEEAEDAFLQKFRNLAREQTIQLV
ncbi:heterokaryon incompatibility protein-domain-containing protein [Dactylonectria macrodidyma]|uniref:Heterokaryon incompatibility protein-domain-containing protein n=1 Tax=Dactylonectria macrodidyma TaxID=307937 RepID=A0A9P9FFC3_9HYPO|nr:heterokaryon incompatibility protein-domain-containing protein [Dactylonectria macrodidyma]